ncbi:glycosyltransferase family 4 protein [Microbispora sp. CA-102843]|uniref:glycosyltransferase family 4 protein n=1 Tax=Microbispora sp. CA-102843 TaxID=3239952 RepID=UPI003D8BE45E
MKPLRILRVGYRLPPERGGKERHLDRLTRQQLAAGHEVVVAHRRGEPPPGTRALPLTPTPASRLVSAGNDVVAFALECAGALSGVGRLDLVHLHGDHRETLVLGPAVRRLGVPLVVTVHGALAGGLHRPLMRRAFRHVDRFIALGTRPRDGLLTAGVPAGRIHTMSSGLDLAHLSEYRGRTERGLVVSVGSLEPVKNHALLIEAFGAVQARHPHARLVIVGEGSQRARLERLAGPGRGVHLAGHLPAEDVYALVGRAEAFVLASRTLGTVGEGVPTAALEALALGTPVVVSGDASLGPAVTDPRAYLAFPSGSAAALAARLDAVLADASLRRDLSRRGRLAAAALDWPLVAARVQDVYEPLLRRRVARLAEADR